MALISLIKIHILMVYKKLKDDDNPYNTIGNDI